MLHVVGMCKMDKRKFEVDGKERNSHAIISMNEFNAGKVRSCEKYKSRYFVVTANYKGTPVKLFYVKYKNATKWTILLTTDLSLSFVKATVIELAVGELVEPSKYGTVPNPMEH